MNQQRRANGGGIAGEPPTRCPPGGKAGQRERSSEARHTGWVCRVEPPGQGVGAWTAVIRAGALRSSSTVGAPRGPLVSPRPRPAVPCSVVLSPGAAGRWGYSVSGSRLSAGCAAGFHRAGAGFRPRLRGGWNSDLARVPAVATGGQSDPRHPALGEPACGGCLKLKEINHLQHTTGAAHYSALPQSVGPHFSAGFPCIPSPLYRPPRRCSS